jgi:ubiquinone/menaquinone biosynthesis C-methylase UbiE
MSQIQFQQQAARGYDQAVGNMTRQLVPTLLRIARISAGERVLDAASGTGIATEAAAAIVGPTGHVTASDIAPAMIEIARARLAGLVNTNCVVEDSQDMTFADEHFDKVICNMGLMYFPDPLRGISEMRRVVRAGGAVSVSVNTAPSTALVSRILPIIDRLVPTPAKRSGPNSFDGSEARLGALFTRAGLKNVETLTETRRLPFVSFDAYFSGIERGAGDVGQEYVALPDDIRRAVREETRVLVGDNGGSIGIDITITFASGQR